MNPYVETIIAIRDEIDVVLEAAWEMECQFEAQFGDVDELSEAHARAQARRRQLEDVRDLLVDAEREVRRS